MNAEAAMNTHDGLGGKNWKNAAKQIGVDAANIAASWVYDGNSDKDERARVLAMLRDGDPAVDDYLPHRPDLSGEFVEERTPVSLFEEVIGRPPKLDGLDVESNDGALLDALADAFEEGVSETFATACEIELIEFCEPNDGESEES